MSAARARGGCPVSHEVLKGSVAAFVAGTVRLPHLPHEEAVQDGLWYRNCPACCSTLVVEVDPGAEVRS